jgi:HAD superfamily hydrolase (TIGR01549 family)
MLKNIFLDAGGVILDENNFENNMAKKITEIIQKYNYEYSLENYWKDVEEAVYRFVPKTYDYILYKNIKHIDEFKRAKLQKNNEEIKNLNNDLELMDGINDFLINYSKYYKIGILGQYGNIIKKQLEKENLLQYFTFSEIQDDYKITKPDPRYFDAILRKCNCNADESIMVGDRIDKDIIPAKLIGMKTIRIKVGIHKNQEPRLVDEIPDLTVEKIEEIKMENIKAMDYCA